MQNKLLTYDEVLEETKENKRFLLLGNGFSMAYNKDRFSFTSLFQSAVDKGLIDSKSPMYEIFKDFDTTDFEEIIKNLEISIKVFNAYKILKDEDANMIYTDAIKLKEHLVDIITNNHPEKITDISEEEFEHSINFVKNYDSVYTLNYDLLLYWTTMKLEDYKDNEMIKNIKLEIGDGFSDLENDNKDYVVFTNSGKNSRYQKNFYLHGALHIFDNKYEIIKNTYSRTKKTLKEQTLENLKKEIYPIFVSEGTSSQKKSKIIHNAYLNHCYRSLKALGGKNSLIIFGTMLKTNDEHIQDAIMESNIKKIYIGIGSIDKTSELDAFVEKAIKHDKKVYFYDYRSVKVWR
ncbi:DUF4917 family protein [Methanocaldococcus sp.]